MHNLNHELLKSAVILYLRDMAKHIESGDIVPMNWDVTVYTKQANEMGVLMSYPPGVQSLHLEYFYHADAPHN